MADWGGRGWRDSGSHQAGEFGDRDRWTIRTVVVRAAALLLLFSFLSSLYVALRGVEHLLAVVGLLVVAAVVGIMAKRQRAAENPYRSDDPTDLEIR